MEGWTFPPRHRADRLCQNGLRPKGRRPVPISLKRFTEERRRVSSSAGQNCAPAIFSSEPSTKKLLKLAMERLFEKKIIRVETSGPASRPINSPDGWRVSGTIRRIASRHYSAEGLLRVCRRLQLDLM